ncbi:MAG: hypothetical protein E5299_02468 [Burkholderia gladioli]|nr:MAG: hypothetical protein E5299_02468 [Burkholderia gladioli]
MASSRSIYATTPVVGTITADDIDLFVTRNLVEQLG